MARRFAASWTERIVVTLHETIRLMAEIDKTIDAHGGWPAAFARA
jgi:hypothetical protein